MHNKPLSILLDLLQSPIVKKDKRALLLALNLSDSLIKEAQVDKLQQIMAKLQSAPDDIKGNVYDGVMFILSSNIKDFDDILKSYEHLIDSNLFWAMMISQVIKTSYGQKFREKIFPVNNNFLNIITEENIKTIFVAFEKLHRQGMYSANGFDPKKDKKFIIDGLQTIYDYLTGKLLGADLKQKEEQAKKAFISSRTLAEDKAIEMGISKNYSLMIIYNHKIVEEKVFKDFFKNILNVKDFSLPEIEKFAAYCTVLFTMLALMKTFKNIYNVQFNNLLNELNVLTKVSFGFDWAILRSLKPLVIKATEITSKKEDVMIDSEEYENAFQLGLENGINAFEPFRRNIPNAEKAISKTVNPKIQALKEDLFDYVIRDKNLLTKMEIANFVEACYMAVALIAIDSRELNKINYFLKIMSKNFSNWKNLTSLGYLVDEGYARWGLSPRKAKEIYEIINPAIINNIRGAMSKNEMEEYHQFHSDLSQSVLSHPRMLQSKHNITIDISDYGHAEIIINNIANKNSNPAANIILERIINFSQLKETGMWPEHITPYQKPKIQEPNEPLEKNYENVEENKQIQNWFDMGVIKISSAILYLLLQSIEQKQQNYY